MKDVRRQGEGGLSKCPVWTFSRHGDSGGDQYFCDFARKSFVDDSLIRVQQKLENFLERALRFLQWLECLFILFTII